MEADNAGYGTSTYQLHINQSVLVAQASVKITPVRVSGATVFIEHFTDYVYAHLINNPNGDKNLGAKHGYEILSATNDHTVKRYCAENGIFGKAKLIIYCAAHGQKVTFFGLGAHHNNGII